MNQTELNKYKAMLEAKKAELSAGLRNREDIAIEKTPDAIDEVQLAGERELAIRNYKKSLELNPQNMNAVEMLKKLEKP